MGLKVDVYLRGRFFKIVLWLQRGLDFSGSGGPSWEFKLVKNRSKNEVNIGRHLGSDFSLILVGLGIQVGRQGGAKIDGKRHRKNDGKKKGSRITKKLEKMLRGPATGEVQGPGESSPLRRDKPLSSKRPPDLVALAGL